MSTTKFTQRMVQARRVAHNDRRRKHRRTVFAVLVSVSAIAVVVLLVVFLSVGEGMSGLIPASSPARVECTWIESLGGGYVQALSHPAGSTGDRVWTLTDGEAVRVVDDPGPSWNPAREVVVNASGSSDPARVRRWNLRPTAQAPSGPARTSKPAARDPEHVTPNPGREFQREDDLYLRLQ